MRFLQVVMVCILVIGCELSLGHSPSVAQGELRGGSLQASDQSASKEKQFDLTYESFKNIHGDYTVDVMKSLAFLILAIGWFVTSNKSREFFSKRRAVRISAIVAAVALFLIHAWASISIHRLSEAKMSLLSALNYVDPQYYDSYRITATQVVLNLVMIAGLFAVLIVILCSLKEAADKSGQDPSAR